MTIEIDVNKIAAMIDHTLLRPDATDDDIVKHCRLAKEFRFGTVCVFGSWLPLVVEELKGSGIRIDVPIGFPFGSQPTEVKAFEAHDAIMRGAHELDMVINISAMKSGDVEYILEDVEAVVAAGVRQGTTIKAIIETCYLDDQEKRLAAGICERAGVDFVKTSTGLGPAGATVDDIRLLKETLSRNVGIKASGGIRTGEQVLAMINAGATRIGTSSGPMIMAELRERLED